MNYRSTLPSTVTSEYKPIRQYWRTQLKLACYGNSEIHFTVTDTVSKQISQETGTYPVLCAYSIFCQKIRLFRIFTQKYSWFFANNTVFLSNYREFSIKNLYFVKIKNKRTKPDMFQIDSVHYRKTTSRQAYERTVCHGVKGILQLVLPLRYRPNTQIMIALLSIA